MRSALFCCQLDFTKSVFRKKSVPQSPAFIGPREASETTSQAAKSKKSAFVRLIVLVPALFS
jgi:hypothetical protein